MDAMTMPFTLKDHSLLEDVRPGDEVEGALRVEKERGEVSDYELTDLGHSMKPLLKAMSDWGNMHRQQTDPGTEAQPAVICMLEHAED